MIDADAKLKLLAELEKGGNAYLACLKANVSRASYYRWRKEDPTFGKLARAADKVGRDNLCDIAEHALLLNVKDKKMDAIKYVLAHNSPRYRPKRQSKVILEHRSVGHEAKADSPATLTDLMRSAMRKDKEEDL